MSKNSFVSRIPYDALLNEMCGEWRKLTGTEMDAAWGMAIVHSVLDGESPELDNIADYLGVDKHTIQRPFHNLFMNGAFNGMIDRDRKELKSYDKLTWGYYGGYACGATGIYRAHS